MTTEDGLWRLERGFWLGGAEHYRQHLAKESLMVFPPPAGVLEREATIESVAGARWREVRFDGCRAVFPAGGVALLAYRAEADRGQGEARFRAQCSSTYVEGPDGWRLALHQQTPIDADEDAGGS